MTTLLWLVSVTVVCFALILGLWRSRREIAVLAERASRPEALLNAKLVYMERLFRVFKPVRLVAKLDRAYRMPSGLIVLVELKCRRINRPFLSDVIQLSAQRMAVMGQTRQPVATYAYVMVKAPTRRALPIVHRVELMSDEQVVALVRRREEILAGRILPRRPSSLRTCDACAFQADCDCLQIDSRLDASAQPKGRVRRPGAQKRSEASLALHIEYGVLAEIDIEPSHETESAQAASKPAEFKQAPLSAALPIAYGALSLPSSQFHGNVRQCSRPLLYFNNNGKIN